jgi:glycosyltransferase involved in cell wall biosynthesis
MLPLVSIVMPSLNQAAFIPAAVESVLSQSHSQIELIVADGGSTDGTQAWLAQRQAQDARLHWFSEPDAGPADALNKALRQAKGTLIGWLNSDDLYTPGAVQRAVQALLDNPEWLMAYGHAEHIDAGGAVLGPCPTLAPPMPCRADFSLSGQLKPTLQFAQGCFICQPTVFFRRTMWVLLGPLDQSLKTAFDFDYWLRAFARFSGRIGFVDAVQAQSRLHADCITLRLRRTVALEGMQVLARHLGYAPKEWLLTYVNELLALPPGERDVGDLKAHVDETLALAKPWLQVADFEALEGELGELPMGE